MDFVTPTTVLTIGAVAAGAVLLNSQKRTPGAPPHYSSYVPYFGACFDFLKGPRTFVEQNTEKFGDVWSFDMFNRRVFYLGAQPELSHSFFASRDMHLAKGYEFLFGGFFEPPKPGHDASVVFKKVLTATNIKQNINSVADDCLLQMNKCWSEEKPVDFFEDGYAIVFRMALRAIVGGKYVDKYFEDLMSAFSVLDRDFNGINLFMPKVPTPSAKRRVLAQNKARTAIRGIIDERQKEENPEPCTFDFFIEHNKDKNGVPDLDQILNDLLGLLFAASTNTALISSWIPVYLSANPEWMEKALKEQDELVKKYGERITGEALDEMVVLEAVMQEVMRHRLHSFLWRMVTKDMQVKGHTIPSGSIAIARLEYLTMDGKTYDNPSAFEPERFLADTRAKSYVFGSGLHPCPGQKLATYETNIFAAYFLRKFRFAERFEKIPEINMEELSGNWPVPKPVVKILRRNV